MVHRSWFLLDCTSSCGDLCVDSHDVGCWSTDRPVCAVRIWTENGRFSTNQDYRMSCWCLLSAFWKVFAIWANRNSVNYVLWAIFMGWEGWGGKSALLYHVFRIVTISAIMWTPGRRLWKILERSYSWSTWWEILPRSCGFRPQLPPSILLPKTPLTVPHLPPFYVHRYYQPYINPPCYSLNTSLPPNTKYVLEAATILTPTQINFCVSTTSLQ